MKTTEIHTPQAIQEIMALRNPDIALFIRMLPLQVKIEEHWSLRDLMKAVQRARRAAFSAARSGTAPPKRNYTVGLNYITQSMPRFHGTEFRDLTTNRVADAIGLDLNLTVRTKDIPGDMKLLFDVNAEIAELVDIEQIPAQFLSVFDAVLNTPDTRIAHIALGGIPEIERAREAAQSAYRASGPRWRTLPAVFLENARRTPGAAALRESGAVSTYAALERRTRAMALGLRRLGVRRGDFVGLQMPRSLDLVVGMLGVMRSGAAFCPLDPACPEARLRSILADTDSYIVLTKTEPEYESVCRPASSLALESLIAENPGDGSLPDVSPDAPAYVMFTSGTTGVPKGVVVTHDAFARFQHWIYTDIFRGDKIDWAFTSSVVFGATLRMFVAYVSGGAIHVYPDTQVSADLPLVQALEDDKVDATFTTPSQLRILAQRRWSLHRLRYLCVVGESLTRDVAMQTREALGSRVEIQNWYGPTEATIATTAHRFEPEPGENLTVPIGRSAPDVVMHILDRGLNPLPNGLVGEIYIDGPIWHGHITWTTSWRASASPFVSRKRGAGCLLVIRVERSEFSPRQGVAGFTGICGSLPVERVAAFPWNRWQDWAGIRNRGEHTSTRVSVS